VTSASVIRGGTERSTECNVTYSLGLVPALVPLGWAPFRVVGALPSSPMQHFVSADSVNLGRRIEPATPCEVVLPACSRDTAATPEGNPPRFLIERDPRPFEAAILAVRHDVAHSGGV
jgi:hypothetical protein